MWSAYPTRPHLKADPKQLIFGMCDAQADSPKLGKMSDLYRRAGPEIKDRCLQDTFRCA